MVPAKRSFNLPATLTFLFSSDGDKTVAHALDFDLVAVADTEQEAERKIKLIVKTYLEYGLSNGWADEIIFPAPDEHWDALKGANIGLMEPIEITDKSIRTFFAKPRHEANAYRSAAISA